jgi:hypothetical protein
MPVIAKARRIGKHSTSDMNAYVAYLARSIETASIQEDRARLIALNLEACFLPIGDRFTVLARISV